MKEMLDENNLTVKPRIQLIPDQWRTGYFPTEQLCYYLVRFSSHIQCYGIGQIIESALENCWKGVVEKLAQMRKDYDSVNDTIGSSMIKAISNTYVLGA